MPRPSRFSLRLQSLVLLVLIPGLLLATALLGWSTYRGLYGIIMKGFDEKLYAVSTVTGSFIRGEDHDVLFTPHQVAALGGDPGDGQPLGIDSISGDLVRLDPQIGGALQIAALPANSRAIAVDSVTGAVWVATADADSSTLYRFDRKTGTATPIGPLAAPPAGLAYDAGRGLLYAGGETLTAIDPVTGAEHPVVARGLAGPVRAPAMAAGDTLFLLGGSPESLIALDLASSTARAVGELRYAPPEDADAAKDFDPDGPPAIRALAITADGGLLGVTHQLVHIDRATAAVDSAGTAPGFRSFRHPLYQQYVVPMERIMAKKDISYLYTEMVGLGGVLTYGIDATQGDDHSVIGSTEPIADNEMPAMERAMVDGEVRLSGIEDWDAWGLLKTADAPIYREDGKVAALAGADIDISLILDKTRVALVKVGIVAALTLLLGAFVSLFISRRLVSPLTDVKEGALQLAAGEYGHRIGHQQLQELGELSESFNSMSGALADTIGELTKTNLALEMVRRGRALEVALADPTYQADPGLPFLVERSQVQDGRLHDPSGYVHVPGHDGGRVLVWMADPIPDRPLDNLRLRREVAAIAEPMIALHPDDWDASAAVLSTLFPQLHCVTLLDGPTRTIRARARVPATMAVISSDGLIREVDLASTPEFVLGPTEWVVLAAHDALSAAEVIRRERIAPAVAGEGMHLNPTRQRPAEPRLPQMAVALFGRELPLTSPERPKPALPALLARAVG
jgi:HAMP domain-containing protein